MEKKEILTVRQRKALALAAQERSIARHFYLTGDTALAGFYLFHRDSEDLDFFSMREVDLAPLTAWLKTMKTTLCFRSMDIETSFNRNLIFLKFAKGFLKLEFTYFPFLQLRKPSRIDGVAIDSLLDIAVNKVFTIAQKPRARDFIDVYCILQKEHTWTMDDLLKKARLKFDWHVDPLAFGTQLLKAQTIADLPRMRLRLPEKVWRSFFVAAAKDLRDRILTA